MAENRKNLCAMIPVELHERVRAAQEQAGVTLSAYITELLTNYFEKGEKEMTEGMRTMAFQMPEELFQRLKAHLERESARTEKSQPEGIRAGPRPAGTGASGAGGDGTPC